MTNRDVLAAIGRRWYVFLAVILAFSALAIAFYRDGGSFYSHTTVAFTLHERPTLLPQNGTTDTSVIAFAGAVATAINEGRPVPTYSSADAPYYGAGVREGVMVSLRNDGSQWISSYPSATIDIQIVGRTRQWVADRQAAVLDGIMDVTRGQQGSAVTRSEQISATIGPLSTEISEITSGRSTQVMAVAAIAFAALIVAATSSVAIDRGLILRRRRRIARPPVAPVSGPAQLGANPA